MTLENAQEELRLARAKLQKNQGSVELENNVRAWARYVEELRTERDADQARVGYWPNA